MPCDAPNLLIVSEDDEVVRRELHKEITSFYSCSTGPAYGRYPSYIMIVNCVREQSISHVRNKITFFTKAVVRTPKGLRKTLVLLDAGWLSREAQSALRRIIEIRNHKTRFLMTSRDGCGILEPILSRFVSRWLPSPVTSVPDYCALSPVPAFRTVIECILQAEADANMGIGTGVISRQDISDELMLNGCKEDKLFTLRSLLKGCSRAVRCPPSL